MTCYLCQTKTNDVKRTEIRTGIWHLLCKVCRAIYES
jgi:hypothetical protein